MMPLVHARKRAWVDSAVTTPILPVKAKAKIKTRLVPAHRTVFAETGETLVKALLYRTAETVQHKAAPRAANSPIIKG